MDDHKSLSDFRIDGDYIDVEPERASISVDEKAAEREERDPQFIPPDKRSYDMSFTFDKSDNGMSGSEIDVEIDKRKVSERDDRGGTRTGFDSSDAEGHYDEKIIRDGKARTRASWLMLLNNGYRDSSRKEQNEQMDNQRWIDTFCSYLDIAGYQKKRTRRIVDSVNMAHFGPYTVEIVVLAAISIVANADNRMIRDEEDFQKLVLATDASLNSINNTRELLKEKSDLL